MERRFQVRDDLGDQLGMEEAIAGSPGWSETGGTVGASIGGMKKYVWSETVVEGGKPFTGSLAHPPTVTGAFQNLGIHDMLPAPEGSKAAPQFYGDGPVVAYRRAAEDAFVESLHPKVTFSGGSPDVAMLSDGDLEKTTKIPIPKEPGESTWIQWEFTEPVTIRSLTAVVPELGQFAAIAGLSDPDKAIESSDDGQNFKQIAKIVQGGSPEHTISFTPVKAKFFRITFTRTPPPPLPAWAVGLDMNSIGIKIPPKPTDYEIAELVLHTGGRVNRFEEKAAFTPMGDLYQFATPSYDPSAVIAKGDVVDLTSKMHPDGTLDWTPPPGQWVVLRFGYSLLGITNHPATKEATGLEVDKLNAGYVKNYMNGYLDSYKETVGPDMMGKRASAMSSPIAGRQGSQNWTDDMIAQFKKRRGYDPRRGCRCLRAGRREL
jgi:hypothetical protein